MPPSAFRRSLFDSPSTWTNDPHTSYHLWLSNQVLKPSTIGVYESMFCRFCDWLHQSGKTLDRCESGDIARFLDASNSNLPESRRGPQKSRQRRQYLRQLERVYAHLNEIGLIVNNPARQASIEGYGEGRDKPTRFLTLVETKHAFDAISEQFGVLRERTHQSLDDWIALRDLALISVLLGAGLKVGNICHLTLNCIDTTEGRIELSQAHYTHRARILPFALPVIIEWLGVRADLIKVMHLSENTPVFISDRSKGFGRQAITVNMHASGIFRRAQRFLETIGIEGKRSSPQTLRNTYAAILIDAGASDDELVDFLGLQASITARRIRMQLSLSRNPDGDGDLARV